MQPQRPPRPRNLANSAVTVGDADFDTAEKAVSDARAKLAAAAQAEVDSLSDGAKVRVFDLAHHLRVGVGSRCGHRVGVDQLLHLRLG